MECLNVKMRWVPDRDVWLYVWIKTYFVFINDIGLHFVTYTGIYIYIYDFCSCTEQFMCASKSAFEGVFHLDSILAILFLLDIRDSMVVLISNICCLFTTTSLIFSKMYTPNCPKLPWFETEPFPKPHSMAFIFPISMLQSAMQCHLCLRRTALPEIGSAKV